MAYTDIKLELNCANCGEEIAHVCRCIHDEDELPSIHMMQFECSEFMCDSCGQSTYTGDIITMSEDEI